MSLLNDWKLKSSFVQRLSLVWCLFAFYHLGYSVLRELTLGRWNELPGNLVFFCFLMALSWSHLKQYKAAWFLSVLLSGLWAVFFFYSLLTLVIPDIGYIRNFGSESSLPWKLIQFLNVATPLVGFVLMASALMLAFAGRAAYGFGGQRAGT